MSIGYIKGKYWVTDDRYHAYSQRESYKALLRAQRQAGFTFNCEFSYTGQRYMAEIITIEKFEKSAQYYFIKHNNAYDPNPMAAVVQACLAYHGCTDLVRACCLEIECELLKEALGRARRREALEAKLDGILHDLDVLVSQTWTRISREDDWHGDIPLGQARPLPATYDEDDDL